MLTTFRFQKLRIFLLNISTNLAVAIIFQIGISYVCVNYWLPTASLKENRKTLYQVSTCQKK